MVSVRSQENGPQTRANPSGRPTRPEIARLGERGRFGYYPRDHSVCAVFKGGVNPAARVFEAEGLTGNRHA